AKVFQTGLLTTTDAADIGWSEVPLAELHVEPARALLERLGAEIREGAKVTEIVTGGAGAPHPRLVRGVRVDGEILEAEAVVLAVPHDGAASLVPLGAVEDRAAFAGLGSSPIVNVHVVFDRKVMAYKMAAGTGSPVQFVFDRTAASGLDREGGGQALAVSLSGAEAEIGERPEVLTNRYVAALGELFPAARGATVLDAVVTREHDATFRGVPHTRALRPGAVTAISNLALAGAWTDTGWPATMEGAVRSGKAAAEVVLGSLSRSLAEQARREEVVA
ncbi:MAG: hydroxysqualene dehydroxylase, partial [Acidimicrobiales bacterium]